MYTAGSISQNLSQSITAKPTQDAGPVKFTLLVKMENARTLSGLLKTLQYDPNCSVTFNVSAAGIKCSVEKKQAMQGSTMLSHTLFQEYNFNSQSDNVDFAVSLHALLSCLDIYGNSPSSFPALQMGYKGHGNPLLVLLEENDVLTDCTIHTEEPSLASPVFNLRSAPQTAKVIMKSDALRDAFGELDWSNSVASLRIARTDPHFQLKTVSATGSLAVDYNKDSEPFESFECTQDMLFEYRLKLLQPCLKALGSAKKTMIRLNARGLLNIQHMIPTEDGELSFVDFYVVAQEDAPSDDEM